MAACASEEAPSEPVVCASATDADVVEVTDGFDALFAGVDEQPTAPTREAAKAAPATHSLVHAIRRNFPFCL